MTAALKRGKQMEIKHILPSDIEKTSLGIIKQELTQMGKTLPDDTEATVIRVIHTTADFEYADTMMFSDGAGNFTTVRTQKRITF